MKQANLEILTAFLLISLVGCSSIPNNMPLIFSDATTVGISMSAATNTGTDFTLGYKALSVAIIPVMASSVTTTSASTSNSASNVSTTNTTSNSASNVSATNGLIQSEITTSGGNVKKDAYSVLGQFDAKASQGSTSSVGLGRFFATGQAAVSLAQGFDYALLAAAASSPVAANVVASAVSNSIFRTN